MNLNINLNIEVPSKIQAGTIIIILSGVIYASIIPSIPNETIKWSLELVVLPFPFVGLGLVSYGLYEFLFKRAKELDFSVEVQQGVMTERRSNFLYSFTFLIKNKSPNTPTAIDRIEYTPTEKVKEGSYSKLPRKDIFTSPIEVKTSAIIESSFHYIELLKNSYIEIIFYHTHGEYPIEEKVKDLITQEVRL